MTPNYRENMQKTYNSVFDNEKKIKEVEATPIVPASLLLKQAGNNLYIDENGVLRVQPIKYASSISRYLENNGLVNTNEQEQEANLFSSSEFQLQ